ncbi:MAG: pilus assembly protein [Proteobacteria bacterium]|nr:pilus assembly protein [Pseudomonadota bacterium]
MLLLALPLGADAAGLGRLTVLSALGQPLRAEVEISASREELSSLSARIATPAAFQQAGIEYSAALAGIRFSIGQRPDGQPFLSMLSERAFNEPFLDLLVELSWSSGRLLREYTFLLDPPEAYQKSQGAATAPLALPEVKRETAAAAVPAPVAPAPVAPVQAAPAPAAASAAAQPEQRTTAPVEEKPAKKPQADLQVIRGADGVQRIVKVAPAVPEKPQQETQQTRLVKQGDTLGKIAAETKPAGVNLDQMLVALFRGNQEAFVGNVNRLKAGKILTIPDRETVAGVAADEARKTIQAHSADFNAYSKKLAATVASAGSRKEAAPQREVSGKIAPRVEEKAPAAVGKDKLEVSKSEAADAGKAGATRLAAIEETLVSREKALKDANGRIAELEKNLADLKKLVELKNQSMAELQKQAQAAKPAAPVATAKEPPAAPQKPVAKAADKPAESIQPPPAAKPAEPVPTPATAKPAEPVQPPAAPKPAAAETQPAPPSPSPAEEPSFIDESPEIVFGGGAVLALLLGYLGYSRWRKKKSAETPAADEYPLARSMASDASMGKLAQGEDLLSRTDFSSQPGGMEPAASVDPVAEAEVYLAYGRDVQAEEILVDALKTDPTRLAIHLKLLEIYAARKSIKQFETIATDLHGQTGATGPDWEKARQLGVQVDPENPLYGGQHGGQQETLAEFDPGATLVIQPQAALENIELAAAEAPAEDLMQEAAVAKTAPGSEEPAAEEVPVSLDFDFDLPLAAQISASAEAPAEPAAQEEPPGSLDIDLGQEADVVLPQSGATTSPKPAAEAPARQEALQSMEVDFDLDLGTPQSAATAPPAMTAESSATADAGLDFDFDLGSSKPGAGPAPAALAEDAAPTEPADGNTIDFDLELPASAAATPAAKNIDLSSISLDLDAPLEPTPAPAAAPAPGLGESTLQDVATKLELAQAYEEMGDKEGARELLQEVLNEGNAAQQEAARNKLAQLG